MKHWYDYALAADDPRTQPHKLVEAAATSRPKGNGVVWLVCHVCGTYWRTGACMSGNNSVSRKRSNSVEDLKRRTAALMARDDGLAAD